jgi:dimethylhistidine N-methyltransferase
MNITSRIDGAARQDIDRFRAVRARMSDLAKGLSAEDLAAQSMADASPGKWHLAHTSWFFEVMLLARRPDYEAVDERLGTLFNSYYEALGARVARPSRGLMTRPSLDEVLAYRREIDRRMVAFLGEGLDDPHERYLFELGLNHDQQHQELFLTDLLHLMSCSPLAPAAYGAEPGRPEAATGARGWTAFDGGLVTVGHDGAGFAFDNEGPAHPVMLAPFRIARSLVTNGDWLAFVADNGYRRPELWLSDGWAAVQAQGWTAPDYWRGEGDEWRVFTLAGLQVIDPGAPVRHISFYEADAFARWSGKRLPTEFEWEHAARRGALDNAFDHVWQWTGSAYLPYPGFRNTPGTAAEYNGKFMANQMVARGGSWATAPDHSRTTYRNFFYPHQRWQFMGLRLAEDAPVRRSQEPDDLEPFARAMVEGLSTSPKAMSPKWFYDAAGSRLFEDITRLPEYYPTRQEAALLAEVSPRLAEAMGEDAVLVEFGSGASEKTEVLLDAAPGVAAYVPIDISETALEEAAVRIRKRYPRLDVKPMAGDFLHPAALPQGLPGGCRVGFFPGSTIGNLDPEEARDFLTDARTMLGEGAMFILGVDLVKDPAVLIAAYDDSAGVTAAFNLNLLERANAEAGADFDLSGFEHQALWNAEEARIEMHLRARKDQMVEVSGRRFGFRKGETIHTENSRKFTPERVTALAESAGWRVRELHVGPEPSVALVLLGA